MALAKSKFTLFWDDAEKLRPRMKTDVEIRGMKDTHYSSGDRAKFADNLVPECRWGIALTDERIFIMAVERLDNNYRLTFRFAYSKHEMGNVRIDRKLICAELQELFDNTERLEVIKDLPVIVDLAIPITGVSTMSNAISNPPTRYDAAWQEWSKRFSGSPKKLEVDGYFYYIGKYTGKTSTDLRIKEIFDAEQKRYQNDIEAQKKDQPAPSQSERVDISKIFVTEEPPIANGHGDMGNENSLYEATIYWPKIYLDKHICDGDTVELYDLKKLDVNDSPEVLWMPGTKTSKGVTTPKYTREVDWSKTGGKKKLYRLRMLGYNSPEVDHWSGDVDGDGTWMNSKSKTISKDEPLGVEAMNTLNKLIPNGTKVLIDCCNVQANNYDGETFKDPDTGRLWENGNTYSGHDKYGRRLGIVYAQVDTGNGKKEWINANRTILARGLASPLPFLDPSRPHCHRAIMDDRVPIQSWGQDNRTIDSVESIFAINHNPIAYTPGKRVDDRKNILGSFDPNYEVRIGDCQFVIPPEQISVSQLSKSERVAALRSRTSIRRDTGQYVSKIVMTVYFTGENQINGQKYENYLYDSNGKVVLDSTTKKPKYAAGSRGAKGIPTYYVNGLRSLVAQFKRTPFLPVENHYLNDIMNIEAVTMVGLTVSNVPGFPNTVKATLNLMEFDHQSYLPMEPMFGSCFDWPLFRYYYQTAMVDPTRFERENWGDELDSPTYHAVKLPLAYLYDRTYLKPVGGPWRNDDFNFFIVDEVALMEIQRLKDYLDKLRTARASLISFDRAMRGNNVASIKTGILGDLDEFKQNFEGLIKNIKPIFQEILDIRDPENKNQLDLIDRTIKEVRRQLDEGPGVIPFYIPDLICTGMSVHYENTITEVQLQETPMPTHQYMGSQDTYVQLQFQTTSEESVKLLRQLHERSSRLIRTYHNILDSDLMLVVNDYINMFGLANVSMEEFTVNTTPNQPGVYDITLLLADVQRTSRRMAELQQYASAAFFEKDEAKRSEYERDLRDRGFSEAEIKKAAEDLAKTAIPMLERDQNQIFGYFKAKEALKRIEVYPDLELPTYQELKDVGFYVQNAYGDGLEQIFAEPDFYIRAHSATYGATVQQALNDQYGVSGGLKLELWDNVGSPHAFLEVPRPSDVLSQKALSLYDYVQGMSEDPAQYLEELMRKSTTPSEVRTILEAASRWTIKAENTKEGQKPLVYDVQYIEAFSTRKDKYVPYHSIVVCAPPQSELAKLWEIIKNTASGSKQSDYIIPDGFSGIFEMMNNMPLHIETVQKPDSKHPNAITVKIFIPDADVCKTFNSMYSGKTTNIKFYQTVAVNPPVVKVPFLMERNAKGKLTALYFSMKTPAKMSQTHTVDGVTYRFLGDVTFMSQWGKDSQGRKMSWSSGWEGEFPHWSVKQRGKLHELYNGVRKAHNVEINEIRYDPITKEAEFGWTDDQLSSIFGVSTKEKSPLTTSANVISFIMNPSDFVGNSMNRAISYKQMQEIQQKENENMTAIIRKIFETEESFYDFLAEGVSEFKYDYEGGPSDNEQNVNPTNGFLTSLNDMIVYDKHNRLIRAFPTFHLSLIDEGKVIGQWKLHDNFYGYQALSSIAVHRSRKQIADTCVIELVNVFKNLTNYDNENSDYYGRPSMWEAFRAIWLSEDYVKESIVNQRPEDLNSIYLRTGTRISLRMGYGANAADLPVVFNGCITEIGGEDVITIAAQSDGIELTSVITAREDANTGTWPSIVSQDLYNGMFDWKTEPRHLICDMLTSRGGFWQGAINKLSADRFKNYSPLGFVHLGNQHIDIQQLYGNAGEMGQNIYRANSRTVTRKDTVPLINSGGNITFCMSLTNKTPWDVIQGCSMIASDYIAAVHPFGFRSTIFYGKPHYLMAYDYGLKKTSGTDYEIYEMRKAYQQLHIYDSYTDIIENQITTSEETMYTNVIGTFRYMDWKRDMQKSETPVIHTDTDIYPEKQKTAVVDTSIVCRGWKPLEILGIGNLPVVRFITGPLQRMVDRFFINEDRVAERVARAALRDYLKDMYQGELMVMGDPTIKPYDLMYITDTKNEMNGMCEVKEIVHQFSEQTGFITSVTPDLCVVNEDSTAVARWGWLHTLIAPLAVDRLLTIVGTRTLKHLGLTHPLATITAAISRGRVTGGILKVGGKGLRQVVGTAGKVGRGITNGTKALWNNGAKEFFTNLVGKEAAKEIGEQAAKSGITSALKGVGGTGKALGKGLLNVPENAGKMLAGDAMAGFLIEMVILEYIAASVADSLDREFRNRQAVVMYPLKLKGHQLTAGIQGHLGCVYGDPISTWDAIARNWRGILKWFLPISETEYFSERLDKQIVDPMALDSYLNKSQTISEETGGAQRSRYDDNLSGNLTSPRTGTGATTEATSGTINHGAYRFRAGSINNKIPRVDYSGYRDPKKRLFRWADGTNVPVYKIGLLAEFKGKPPLDTGVSPKPSEAFKLYAGAIYGVEDALKILDALYGHTEKGVRCVNLSDNRLDIHSRIRLKNTLIPYLALPAYGNLKKILNEMQSELNNMGAKNVRLVISSVFRTTGRNNAAYSGINKFSDHMTGMAVDIAGIDVDGVYYPVEGNYDTRSKKWRYKWLSAVDQAICRVISDNGGLVFAPWNDMKIHHDHWHVTLGNFLS